ncbi:SPFH domain-containing protein [Dehalococcoidia bacterium]|nr:SPFH domain-containing protein [Dehalococcoidia bacterium]
MPWIISAIIGVVVLMLVIAMTVKAVPEYQRGVVFRLGRLIGPKGPGLVLIIPFVDQMIKVDVQVITMDVPSQEAVTRDNWNVEEGFTIKFKVVDPVAAVVDVPDHIQKTSEVSQAAFRNLLIQSARNELVALDEVSQTLQLSINKETKTWGVEVIEVQLKKMTFT